MMLVMASIYSVLDISPHSLSPEVVVSVGGNDKDGSSVGTDEGASDIEG